MAIDNKADIVIIGAGAVGLAIAYTLSLKNNRTIVVLEKNKSYGQETSSRNSEVIHSGLYYDPKMLKSILCVQGNTMLYEFCEKNRISRNKCGKLVIAGDNDRERFYKLCHVAKSNNVDTRLLTSGMVKALEPDIFAAEAMLVQGSGVISAFEYMRALYQKAREQGVIFVFDSEVIGIEKNIAGYSIKTSKEIIATEIVINSAGLHSDKIARLAGLDINKMGLSLHYCKGEYFRVRNRFNVKHLIYPVPDINSLGIHLTVDVAGGSKLGPSAFYVDEFDYTVNNDNIDQFYIAAKRYIPNLQLDDLSPDFAGIRPKLQGPGEAVRDYYIEDEKANGLPGFINLIGIESPGLTSSLAIGRYVESLI